MTRRDLFAMSSATQHLPLLLTICLLQAPARTWQHDSLPLCSISRIPRRETRTGNLPISGRQLCSALQQHATGKQLTWARSGHPIQNWCLSFSGYVPWVSFAAWLNKPWTHYCLSFCLPFFPSWLSKMKSNHISPEPSRHCGKEPKAQKCLQGYYSCFRTLFYSTLNFLTWAKSLHFPACSCTSTTASC